LKKRFDVHAEIVSRDSKVFRRLTEGTFKESIEKVVELPDVEPRIFDHFLAYAYATPPRGTVVDESVTQQPPMQRISVSKIIQLLLKNGQRKFKCKSCSQPSELIFSSSFPHCGSCDRNQLRSLIWRAHCVVPSCAQTGEYLLGLACVRCLREMQVLSWSSELMAGGGEKVLLGPTRPSEELQSFHFGIPLRAREISGAPGRFPAMAYLLPATLPDTAELAIFADIYGINPLSQAVLESLYQKLDREPLDEDSIASVCKVTEFIYDHTVDSDTNGSSGGSHVYRRMLAEFIATHQDKFIQSRSSSAEEGSCLVI
jgi:hypothetical protein